MSVGRAVGLLMGVTADAVLGDAWQRAPRTTWRLRGPHPRTTACGIVGGALVVGAAAERSARGEPASHATATAAAVLAVLRAKKLADSGTGLVRALGSADHEEARARLSSLSNEDTRRLGQHGIARVTVESVAENTVHAVVAPLFWGAVAGVPGMLGYAAVRALRPRPPYFRHGWSGFDKAVETINRAANVIPARATAALAVACAPVVGGSASSALRTWRLDARAHPDGNGGHAVAATAGALQVRLGGRSSPGFGARSRPVVGHGRTPDSGDVTRCVELSRVIGWSAGAAAAIVAIALPQRQRRRPKL